MGVLRLCKMCGREFGTTTNKFYCSDKCRKRAKLLNPGDEEGFINKTCPFCGNEFKLPICRANNNRKYCSKECSRLANIKNACKSKSRKRKQIKNDSVEEKIEPTDTVVKVVFPDWVKPTRRI